MASIEASGPGIDQADDMAYRVDAYRISVTLLKEAFPDGGFDADDALRLAYYVSGEHRER